MIRVVALAGVAVALAVVLALNGTSVLPRLSTKNPTPQSTPTSAPTTPAPTTTPSVAVPSEPVPGTVITARPEPRRCPAPPCAAS